MMRHDEDGNPYVAYFRGDLVMGFMWDLEGPVQVCREMGEPILATFPFDPGTVYGPALLARFQEVCDLWAEEAWKDPDTFIQAQVKEDAERGRADYLIRTAASHFLHGQDPQDFNLVALADALGVDRGDVEALS